MRRILTQSIAPRIAALLLVGSFCGALTATAQSGAPTLSVDVSAGRYAIDPNIYGIANYGLDTTFAKEIKVPNIRWGGDGTTRYNWQVDSSNAGFDWYFTGGNGEASPVPGAGADTMVKSYPTAGALITIPIIPYVNKSAAWNCSFPVSVYGAQQATNPYIHPDGDNCGNSIATNGTQLADTNIYANHIDNTAALQQGWVQHLVATFGTAADGGVPFYQMDNEPYGWSNTHRDVEPNGADYPTITTLGEQYAAVVKAVDPSAMVLGPSDFTLGGWIGNTSQQGGLYAAQYYLQQMAAYEQAHGTRILDYLDEHYYPQFTDQTSQLASTRTFWDPTYNGGTWVEQYVFNGPMQLLPRMQGWVSQYYPGTRLAISEYSVDSGNKTIVDALTEMDVLGIFGRQQLNFANMWNAPAPADPIAYAFRMYRDYDGNGSEYGDTWVSAVSSDQSRLSVYAAQRSTDNAVTILVLNKTTGAINTTLTVANTTLPGTASVYSYSAANLTQIVNGAATAISTGNITYNFPGYSATLFTFIPATTALGTTSTTLSASATQLTPGQAVTFTATVTGADAPTGTVTFNDGGTSLGSSALASGQASFSTSALSAGTHVITAAYGGDTSNASSVATALTVTVTAPPPILAATTTTLSTSATQINVGQSVSLTAAVSGSASPTGSVTFNDGSSALGSISLAAGQAAMTTSSLSAGTHTILAAYGGDAANAASTSTAMTITVASAVQTQPGPASFQLTLAQNGLALAAGASGEVVISLTPQNGFSSQVLLSCTGLPAGAACNFSPGSLTPVTPDSSSLTITTSANTATLFGAWVLPPWLAVLLFRRRRRVAALGIGACALLLMAGCGVSVNSAQTGTPAGTYSVQVTATAASGETQTQQLVLTIH